MEELKIGDRVRVIYPHSTYQGKIDIIIDIIKRSNDDTSWICKDTGSWGYRSSLELVKEYSLARESLMF